MSYLKSFVASLLGFAFILFCYYKISIPLLPTLGLIIGGEFLNDGRGLGFRKLLILVLGVSAIALYGYNTYYMIGANGKILGIIFEAINTFALLGALIYELILNSKRNSEFIQS